MVDSGLRRAVSLPFLLLYGLGNILGAGIYVLIGKVVGEAGLFAPLAFFLAAVVAGFTAFAYAELAARFPVSAGEAVYVREAFGRDALSRVVGLLLAGAGVISAATIARGFVGYFQVFFPWPEAVVLVLLVLALGGVAAWGIRQSLWLAALFTLVEVGGLLLVVWVARDGFADLAEFVHAAPVLLEPGVGEGILLGAFLAFYAFIGFEDMVNIAEEVRAPERAFPPAMIGALLVAAVLYALVTAVAVLSLSVDRLGASDAPLALIYAEATDREPVAITVISLFAVVNGALIQMIMASRVLYGMARSGWLPGGLARVHPRTRTPVLATGLVSAVVLGLALWMPLVRLAEGTSYLILTLFILVNAALIRIRHVQGRAPGVRAVPLWVPWIGLASSAGLLLSRLV